MNTNTFTLDGERITVTCYGDNDYDIFFEEGDFSVRGTMLDVVKTFAEWQNAVMDEPAVSFEWNGIEISNPWLDDSFRFPIDSPTACRTYGEDNVLQFIIDACVLLRPEPKRR